MWSAPEGSRIHLSLLLCPGPGLSLSVSLCLSLSLSTSHFYLFLSFSLSLIVSLFFLFSSLIPFSFLSLSFSLSLSSLPQSPPGSPSSPTDPGPPGPSGEQTAAGGGAQGPWDPGAGWGRTPGAPATQEVAPETQTNPGVRDPRPGPPAHPRYLFLAPSAASSLEKPLVPGLLLSSGFPRSRP